ITGDNANNFFIGLDSLDNPVISYTVGTINGEILKFAKFNQSTNSWQSIILDSGSPTNGLRGYGPTSITVNQEDDISVIYYSGNRVNIISQQNGIWQTPYFIDAPTAGDAGRHISADIDSYGMPRISYQANLDPFGFGLHHIRLLPDFRIDSISPNNAEAGNTVQVSVTGDGFDMLPKYTRDIDITNDFDFSVQDYSIFVENPLFDESSLVGSYHLDDANELDVTDSSGWDNTGSGTPFSYVDNGYGKALDLDGIDDYVYFSDINIANTSSDEFTLCGWWNWDVYPGQGGTLLFSNRQHNTPTSTGIDVSVKPGLGGIKLRTTSDSDVQSSVDFGVGMSTGTWYHICVISEASNSGDYKVSFNGAIDPSDVVSKSGLQSWTQSGGYLELGGYGSFLGTQYTDAQVDEIKIYERALTDQEISDIFNSTFRADYGDVRFWDSDGNSLEYEMLSDGNFMINIPSMSALETRTIHMTYGALGLDSESQLLDEWPSNNSSTTITPLISYDFEDSYAVNPPPSQSTCYNLVNDSSGNQNHGTVYGNENQCGVNGFDGDGIKLLEASNDYIEIDSGDWQNSSVATVSYHVNLTGFTHTGGQVVGFSSDEFYNNGIRAGISLGITSNGNVECQVGDSVSNTAPSIVTTNLSLTTGVWYHLLCSWDNITLRLYVDGLLSHTHTPTPGSFNGMSWGPGFSGPGPALLGKYSTHFTGSNTMYTAYSDALYDNFAYFDYAVPDEVIAELFSTQNLWPLTINNYGIIGVENLHNYGITLENSVSIAIQTTSVSIINSTTINFTIPPASYSSGFYDVVLADVFGNELYRFTNGFEFTAPPDTDGDGWANDIDAFPLDSSQWLDGDGDGYGDNASGNNSDAFPNDSTQWLDGDGDGYGDNSTGSQPDDCVTVWGNSTIGQLGCPDNDGDGLSNTEDDCPDSNNSIGSTDTDGDGCLDAEDAFPDDNTEHEDSDGDGIGDNSDPEPEVPLDSDGDGYPDLQGYLNSDDCPEVWGNSTGQLVGCLDADGDGLADSIDAFPSDADRTYDEDMDGYDDLIEDDCPDTGGNSTIDLLGCVDSDGDGVSDINDLFPNDSTDWNDDDGDGVGNNSDAFPQDANETIDSDGDGVGDNGDLFPQDSNESIDSDGDGIGDNEDQYPLQDNFIDTDNDGIFDVEDVFPTDPTQWQDADNDGYGDNLTGLLADLFPSDDSQWADLDNDGYGDNWGNATWNLTRLFIWPGMYIENASLADHCPDTWGNSSADGYFGCPDLDGDTI
ncbi:hypothetical protein OAT52_00500, partial [bacterium]|nr:hypothetical protein [bacterium]